MDDSEIETPPASTRAISRLAKVVVDERIIRLEGNRTCVICFEDHLLGSYATRLPCQHIFCRSCIVEWLRKKCTCPNCRYELRTDSTAFENRKHRRPLRFSKERLNMMKVGELTRLAETLRIDIASCVTKKDLLRCLMSSSTKKLNIVETEATDDPSATTFDSNESTIAGKRWTNEMLMRLKVRELRRMTIKFQIASESFVEKSDFVKALVDAQRRNLEGIK